MKFIDSIKEKMNDNPKLKSRMIAGGILIGIFLVTFLVIHFWSSSPAPVYRKKPSAKIFSNNKFLKESWYQKASNKLDASQYKINQLSKQNKKLALDIKKLKEKNKNSAPAFNLQNPKGVNYPRPPLTQLRPGGPPVPNFGGGRNLNNPRPPAVKVSITSVPNPINTILNSEPEKSKKKAKKARGFYIPAGAFTEGLLLNGMDAPASFKGKSNPYPALIRLTNLSFLPNKYRIDMKNCFVLAAGYGNLSSERVMLRTNTLSCVVRGGKGHVTAALHGYIVGDHGKVGLRGKVVTKQGAILAREIMAGFLQGIANVGTQSSMTYQYSGIGTVGTMNPSDIGIGAAASGLGTAAASLSKFYMKLAKSMFPVVIVGAGRKLTIVVTHGMYVSFKKNVEYKKSEEKKKP